MSSPRVAICVVTYNSAPLIKDLVASLPAGAAGTDWSLVFADNASSDGTLGEINRYARKARVVKTGANLGYAAGVNAAVQAAGSQDAYLILNADVRLTPGCVSTLCEALHEGVGLVVPRLIDADGELIWSMRREPSISRAWADALLGAERAGKIGNLGEIVTEPDAYATAGATDWAEGSTLLIGSKCWQACGNWDETFFLYSEETEYALRARDHGFVTWYLPTAIAQHLEGGSADNARQWSLLTANRVKMFGSRHGRFATALFWAAIATREGSRALLGKKTSRTSIRDLMSPARMRQHRGPEWLQDVKI